MNGPPEANEEVQYFNTFLSLTWNFKLIYYFSLFYGRNNEQKQKEIEKNSDILIYDIRQITVRLNLHHIIYNYNGLLVRPCIIPLS
jgi:hypothetical protein